MLEPATLLPDIEGDVAFVTGAASGIGLAVSKALVNRGESVIMLDINEEGCKKAATELNEKAGKKVAIAVKADTTCFKDQLAAYELGKEAFGRVDYCNAILLYALSNFTCIFVVFANAGIAEHPWLPPFDPSTASSRAIIEPDTKTLDVSLNGQLNTAALAFQVFERQKPNPRTGFRGKLVMTASVYGYWSCKSMPMYAAAKAGVVNFVRGLARYYGDKGVTVNMVGLVFDDVGGLVTPIAPPDFVELLGEHMFSSVDFVAEKMISVLGSSKDNGRAISIVRREVWDHPEPSLMYEQNKPGMDFVEDEVGRRMGLWK
ncbi:hypothetical protein VKT23_014942 [Stygiomarasmius scandens]|uniref:NAD(P)-binding protein n=1 Tax=Marasmiellus scandens TaxID=2682957 RepID=A0ABR1J270_9AGAR